MSSLNYINEDGAGQKHSDLAHYSQAVVLGNIARLSGQGGWDQAGDLDQYDWKQQIDNAFDNVERVLRAAGFRGWEDVYSIRSYQTDVGAHWEYFVGVLKERVPGHRPLWTALGVAGLAFSGMTVEIEVEAIKHGS